MSDDAKPEPEVREGSRIAKVMARAGLCSRREAETWIAAGRVTVNGKALESPAYNVSEADDVRVDGVRLGAPERTRLFLFHKPRGFVTTARDPEGRQTIFERLPPDLPRLIAVGRLDINTEGLMLLTNDGGLARVLELPATGWLRRYRVRAHGAVDQARLDPLSDGITLDGIHYAGIEARLDREQGSNAWITIGLREGKNREIKRVLEHLGLAVNRLIRVSFGPFELGDLAEGEITEVRTRILRDQLGLKLAREAGVDFDAPIVERAAPAEPPREERPKRPGGAGKSAGRARRPDFERDRDEPPRRKPPAPSTPERRRKHVSALRAEIAADAVDAAAPRKRIARGATTDRKGRTVAVERISKTRPEAEAPEAPARRPRKEGPRRGRPPGRSPGGDARREFPERPRRPASFEATRARDGEGRERPPRAERREGGGRPEFKPRGERTDRGSGASRPRPASGAGRERPPRAERKEGGARAEFKPRGERKGKNFDAPRPPRAGGDEFRPRTQAPKAEGDAPRGRDDAPRGASSRSGPGGPGGSGGRAPGGRGGKPMGAPGGGRRPGGGPSKGGAGPRRPPGKR